MEITKLIGETSEYDKKLKLEIKKAKELVQKCKRLCKYLWRFFNLWNI